jgi:hypothetical protein
MKFDVLPFHSDASELAHILTAADTEKDYPLGCPWAFHKDQRQYRPAKAVRVSQTEDLAQLRYSFQEAHSKHQAKLCLSYCKALAALRLCFQANGAQIQPQKE